jgi:predicted dienelactone hydrolase
MKKVILFVVLLLLAPCWAQSATALGVRILSFDNHGKPLPVMVWYPAEVSENIMPFGYYGQVEGKAILNAKPQEMQHPLIVFSHGLGMCSFQSVFLMEFLAENGYIVAAPDHDDAALCHIGGTSEVTNCQLTKSMLKSLGNLDKSVQALFPDKLHYLDNPAYRPWQISLVIDSLLADPVFSRLINQAQIGVMGHSFGGWTAEAVAGAEIDCQNPSSYAPSVCEASDQDLSTAINNGKICCQDGYRGQISHFRDSRVRAVIVLGPGSFIFPHYGAWKIETPIMFISGDHFEVDFQTNLLTPYNLSLQPKYLLVFQTVGHMTASDLVYQKPGAVLLRQFWCYQNKKRLYEKWSLGFFNAYLSGSFHQLEQNISQQRGLKSILHQD